jgi:hypothetical protein
MSAVRPRPIFDSLKIDILIFQSLTAVKKERGTTPATFARQQIKSGSPYSGCASGTILSVGGIATPAAW